MGTFRSTFQNPLSSALTDRAHTVAERAPQHVGPAAVSKTTVAVSKTGALTNAEHQARWRKAHPEQHRVQQQAARARRKVGA